MKIAEIRDLPSEEISALLAETRRGLFNLRFQRETEQLEKTAEINKARRDVARCLTVLRERQVAEAAEPVSAAKE